MGDQPHVAPAVVGVGGEDLVQQGDGPLEVAVRDAIADPLEPAASLLLVVAHENTSVHQPGGSRVPSTQPRKKIPPKASRWPRRAWPP